MLARSYLEDVGELTLTDPVPVHDDPVGLVATGRLVEHGQVLLDLGEQGSGDVRRFQGGSRYIRG